MRSLLGLTLYRLLLPVLFLAAFPGWLVKMLRRGGFGSGLAERLAIYRTPLEFEPCGAAHCHAISVGETLLALKLIREWRLAEPDRPFVIATGTATGHAVATAAGLAGVRVTYAPLDFRLCVRRYLGRFEPSQIVLIEGEVWPNLMLECHRRGIPTRLVNARMSPRSARRFRRFAPWLRPFYQNLGLVALQDAGDAEVWQHLGVPPDRVVSPGSLKFDPGSGPRPPARPEFQALLDAFGRGRPVVLAASTHPGEETWIATAIREADPAALAVIVPRHAERRALVASELERAGRPVVLRSSFPARPPAADAVFVIDSTGELRDWTAHADVVVIGKSFLATGGQNPAEAVLAGKPLVTGPHMENFQPFAARLAAAGGCLVADDQSALADAIRGALRPATAAAMTRAASDLLEPHHGATRRIIGLLDRPFSRHF